MPAEMLQTKLLKEEKIGKFLSTVELLLSFSEEEMTKVFEILERKQFPRVLVDKTIADNIASEISRTTKKKLEESEDLVEAMANLGIIDNKDKLRMLNEDMKTIGFKPSEIKRLNKVIVTCQRKGISRQLRKSEEVRRLSEAIIPFLSASKIALDVRYSFTGNKIRAKVPIALIRLKITVPGEKEPNYVRFQTTSDVLKLLIRDLRKTYKKLDLLEKSR